MPYCTESGVHRNCHVLINSCVTTALSLHDVILHVVSQLNLLTLWEFDLRVSVFPPHLAWCLVSGSYSNKYLLNE